MDLKEIKRQCRNRWDRILIEIAGLKEKQVIPTKKGMPCPNCGGVDRYEFKSVEDGYHLCRGCGAGDGWSMVMKIHNISFKEALDKVDNYLNGHGSFNAISYKKNDNAPQKRNESVIKKAQWIWDNSSLNPSSHPYLIKKQIPPLKLRQYKGSLVSAIYDQNFQLVNLQFIDKDGNKRFLKNGITKNCFQWWGNWGESWTIFFCEGVANAISVFLAKKLSCQVVTAYSAGNIKAVITFVKNKMPEQHRMLLAFDHDEAGQFCLRSLFGLIDGCTDTPKGMDISDGWIRDKKHERNGKHYRLE